MAFHCYFNLNSIPANVEHLTLTHHLRIFSEKSGHVFCPCSNEVSKGSNGKGDSILDERGTLKAAI
jgi:hypothetical protein